MFLSVSCSSFAARGHWAGGWAGDTTAAVTLTSRDATVARVECCGTFVIVMLFVFTEVIHG